MKQPPLAGRSAKLQSGVPHCATERSLARNVLSKCAMLHRTTRVLALGVALSCAVGCASLGSSGHPREGWLEHLSAAPPPPPGKNFPLPPPQLDRVMREELDIRSGEHAGSGVMGALRIEAYYPSIDRALSFKWKTAPSGGDGWNNSPRREIAAYLVQQWFLTPENYVVPPTIARCIALEEFAEIDPDAEPNLPNARCVFGNLSIWLQDVEDSDKLDEERFYRDAHYARHFANFNLLTYLTRNRDSRPGNFLIAKDESSPRVFSVDNGIAFGEWIYNFFLPNYDVIRVPALPRDSIERLRKMGEEELEALLVVAEFRTSADGVVRERAASAAFDVESGSRIRDGVLQLGLEPSEIDGVRDRLRDLIAEVDAGEIPLF